MKKDNKTEIYLGPSFFGIIQKGTVLKRGYPQKFQTLLDLHPFLNGLLIPTESLSKKRKELKAKQSEIALLYRRAEELKEEIHV